MPRRKASEGGKLVSSIRSRATRHDTEQNRPSVLLHVSARSVVNFTADGIAETGTRDWDLKCAADRDVVIT
jgi:hypothetical protein